MIGNAWRRLESRHRGWRYRVMIDPMEIGWLRTVLRPGDVAVDAGAHKGGYTYWMRDAVGDEGHVYAFEPQPDLATFLTGRVEAFGWSNVTVEDSALSASEGSAELMVPGRGPSKQASLGSADETAHRVEVPLVGLDDYLARRVPAGPVRLIKCDVEGHELEAFEGATAVLRDHRPLVLFECEARHQERHTVEGVFEHLMSRGYRGWFFQGDTRRDVSDFRADVHQVPGRRPYVNNFVFEPESSGSRGPE